MSENVTLEMIEEAARLAGCATSSRVFCGSREVSVVLDGLLLFGPLDRHSRQRGVALRILQALALAKEEAEQVKPSGYAQIGAHDAISAEDIEDCARQLGGRIVWVKQ